MNSIIDLARRAWTAIDRALQDSAVVRFAAPALSFAVLCAALVELYALDWDKVLAIVPRNPLFWMAFPIFYFVQPVCDWAIYHRIWRVPFSGIGALVSKTVGNELLMGYAGEAYLYAWARREGQGSRAALSAVKDVSILSAAVGNSVTVVMALVAIPFMGSLNLGIPIWAILLSLCIVITTPLVAIVLRGKLFGLPRADLLAIVRIHALRSFLGIGLTALLWHLALPGVAVKWWLVFSALKLLVSRLPLVSNKDLVFAGLAVVLLGRSADVPALMTMMATLMVCAHVVMGIAFAGAGLIEGARKKGVAMPARGAPKLA